jgi:2'-5' RNA ligase
MPGTETKRLFVAIFPPAHLVNSLQGATAGLAKGFPARTIRWIQPKNLHLTLNFLGAIDIARIPEIQSALKAACDGHRQHTVRVAGLGCFPNRSRPQIIWAGLAGDLRPLESLKKSIDAHFAAAGCVCEDRPFRPHLTVGRVVELNPAGRRQVAKALAQEKDHDFGEWRIGSIDLMQSVLSPQGAAYGTLQSILLEHP